MSESEKKSTELSFTDSLIQVLKERRFDGVLRSPSLNSKWTEIPASSTLSEEEMVAAAEDDEIYRKLEFLKQFFSDLVRKYAEESNSEHYRVASEGLDAVQRIIDGELDCVGRLEVILVKASGLFRDNQLVSESANIHNGRQTSSSSIQGERWSKPMSKCEMMGLIGLDGYRKFNSWAKQFGLKSAGNRQLWTIRVDIMDVNTRKRFE
jgi:hypothetical protein